MTKIIEHNTLKSIYQYRESGKVSDKWHSYLNVYDRIFFPYRTQPIRLLEVGVQNGGSLEIWDLYFRNAELLIGCDINPACSLLNFDNPNIKLVIGDINEISTLNEILKISGQFDIIIDDGSHNSRDIINSFCLLFPCLVDGGIYVIEDIHASYWQSYGGGLYHPSSANNFFKVLTDFCNREHWVNSITNNEHLSNHGFNLEFPLEQSTHIHRIEFMNSMCLVFKKPSDDNKLGKRLVSGNQEIVCQIKHLNGSTITPPDQSKNEFTNPDKTKIEALKNELEIVNHNYIIATEQLNFYKSKFINFENFFTRFKSWLFDLLS